MNYNIAKHLLGKTRFTELKLPRIKIRRIQIRSIITGNGSADPGPDPYQNVMDPKHWSLDRGLFYVFNG